MVIDVWYLCFNNLRGQTSPYFVTSSTRINDLEGCSCLNFGAVPKGLKICHSFVSSWLKMCLVDGVKEKKE